MVASKFGLGGLVFLLGRFAVVAVHEIAHGLTMASFGRRVERAGLKLIAIFPYAFVDTSRGVVRAAPAADRDQRRRAGVGLLASAPCSRSAACCCPTGTVRDIFFQLAFAAYVGAFFNLNPFIERDGYHMLVDWLREPGLRRRAQEQFARRLSRRRRIDDSPVLARYSLCGLGWSVLAALLRDRDVAALRADLDGARAGGGRLRRHGHALGRVLPAR